MELAAARRGCKVCGKSFPCGRSLGGHMRSHLSLGDAAAEVDADNELRRASADGGRSSNGAVGYGLRENPRKTRRLSDFAEEKEEDGGDVDVDGEHKACRECGKLFSSWRSLFGHMRNHAFGGRDRDEDEDVDVEEEFVPEEAEAEYAEMVVPMEAPVPAPATVLAAAPMRRRRSMCVAAPAPAPPPVPSGFEKEQEDVALCLLMLSRDTGLWSSPVKEEPFEKGNEHKKATMKQARLPRNGRAYDSEDDSALLQYGDAKIKSGVAKSRKRSSPKQQREAVATKRTRYECPGCGKVFSSYQALGGHRASHKRINTSCSAPKVTPAPAPAPEPSVETYTSFSILSPSASPDSVAIGISKAKAAVEKFECPVCFRVFASGQALGGHKRSHVMADDDGELYAAGADQEQHSVAVGGFLDLNLPLAPLEEA
ncbi:zinc finger protein ZAT9-like [Phragmites australis]|uniref:zinc finger protein ZAT9-like n=1 Tax=Phragmites australis TaxID=29695 RepID=UPI002D786CEB|nr:zinc finger protein ZAT9-like [Phragmites australis]